MIEPKIILVGLTIHFLSQMYHALKIQSIRPSKNIMWISIISFLVVGILLTIFNLNQTTDFGKCGTKSFNPFTFISIGGNILNLIVFLVSFIILRVVKTIRGLNKRNASM